MNKSLPAHPKSKVLLLDESDHHKKSCDFLYPEYYNQKVKSYHLCDS